MRRSVRTANRRRPSAERRARLHPTHERRAHFAPPAFLKRRRPARRSVQAFTAAVLH